MLLTSILQYGHFLDTVAVDQSGALVNLANNHGNTGLHEAVRGGHVQLVELLLHRGALVHMRNKRLRTALDCAHETAGKVCVCMCSASAANLIHIQLCFKYNKTML